MRIPSDITSRAYRLLIEPKAADEDARRREFIVNVILLGSIALACFLFLSACVNSIDLGTNYEGIGLAYLALIIVGLVSIYIFSRKGYFEAASYLVIGIYFSGAVFETITWGPELPENTMPYTLVIIMAYVLVGNRLGFIATGIISSILVGTSILQEKGILNPDLAWKLEPTDVSDSIEQSVIYLIIMLVSWLSAREIARSLFRARTSEEALRKERDNLEETLMERTRELHSAQAVKIADIYRFVEFGKLASGIFHDLMSPLTSVALSIEELRGNNPDTENDPVSKAVFASKSIQNYMKALRRQMSADEKKVDFSPTQMAEEVFLLLEYKIRHHKAKIAFDPTFLPTGTLIYGNPLKFQQILINLISNALHACASTPDKDIRIMLWEENNALRLSVSDSGCGMSDMESQRIFEPFYTTKPENEGSGLGLSITKTIIEHDFKGTISVTSREGRGSLFDISIPLHIPSTPNLS